MSTIKISNLRKSFGHVDVLNVVKAVGNEKLLNVLGLEHIVEVACLDQSVFMAAIWRVFR